VGACTSLRPRLAGYGPTRSRVRGNWRTNRGLRPMAVGWCMAYRDSNASIPSLWKRTATSAWRHSCAGASASFRPQASGLSFTRRHTALARTSVLVGSSVSLLSSLYPVMASYSPQNGRAQVWPYTFDPQHTHTGMAYEP